MSAASSAPIPAWAAATSCRGGRASRPIDCVPELRHSHQAMIEERFHIEPATWAVDGEALRAIREGVFVAEQGVPPEEELDALDAGAEHVLARTAAGEAIGTARLTNDGRIGRMAVVPEWRGQGVGAAMLRHLLEQARARGLPEVTLHAQTHCIDFYSRAGFIAEGPEFDECGIAHRNMRLALAPPAPRPAAAVEARPEARVLRALEWSDAQAAAGEILAAARNELAILTQDLDPALLDSPEALAELKRVALSGRRARLRILVADPRGPLADGHRLIPLAQRLTSAIELRMPVEDVDLQYPSAFLLNDRGGYFFRPLAGRGAGSGSTCNPGRHAQLLAFFDEAWERARPIPELRVLGL